MASTPDRVRIHYRRLPDRDTVFVQRLVHRTSDCIVTLMDRTPLARPLVVDGAIALEDGSPVVWFTFPGKWHDVGRFHRADGRFTGIYANVLTPVELADGLTWSTTDLFLDVWIGAGGSPAILDEDELDEAIGTGAIDAALAGRARSEAARLIELAAKGLWPPAVVAEWPLERAVEALADGSPERT